MQCYSKYRASSLHAYTQYTLFFFMYHTVYYLQDIDTAKQSLGGTELTFDPKSSYYWRTNTSFFPSGRWFVQSLWISNFLQNYTANNIPYLYVEHLIFSDTAFNVCL